MCCGHFPIFQEFLLTLMLTHANILLDSGSLSAATVAKIGTHSVSGAKHKRHPLLRKARLSTSSFIFFLVFLFHNFGHAIFQNFLRIGFTLNLLFVFLFCKLTFCP